jgi:hypothetical protein
MNILGRLNIFNILCVIIKPPPMLILDINAATVAKPKIKFIEIIFNIIIYLLCGIVCG